MSSPKDLKTFLDLAQSEPIRIQRPDGSNFVLMSEQNYQDIYAEIASLQRRLQGMSEIIDGKTKPLARNEDRTKRFKKKSKVKKTKKKS